MGRQKDGLRHRITENMTPGRVSKIDFSTLQEKGLMRVIAQVHKALKKKFSGIHLEFSRKLLLNNVIAHLHTVYKHTDFTTCMDTSFMMPDGGISFLIDANDNAYPILIGERKNQGTNDLRQQEGLRKQARGNAIERLGKNVIGLKTYTMEWGIFPFVCFGDGCDFADDSSIIDRVKTIAMFGELNHDYLVGTDNGMFLRGSFYFREKAWTEQEMFDICYRIAERSVFHFFARYGEENFLPSHKS